MAYIINDDKNGSPVISFPKSKNNSSVLTAGTLSAGSSGYPEIGSAGQNVEEIQKQLLYSGYDPGLINGIFGPETDKAIREFQSNNGFPANGVVSPAVGSALINAANKKTEDITATSEVYNISMDSSPVFAGEYTVDEIQAVLNSAYSQAGPIIKARSTKIKAIIDSSLYKMKEMYITENKQVPSSGYKSTYAQVLKDSQVGVENLDANNVFAPEPTTASNPRGQISID